MATIAVFGSFDGLHPGHIHMLEEAKRYGEVLVILAQDEVIRRLKAREPYHAFDERMRALDVLSCVDRIVPSDAQEGEYVCIVQEKPDLIGFGYDQDALCAHFLAWQARSGHTVPHVRLAPFHPETFKTSLLKNAL